MTIRFLRILLLALATVAVLGPSGSARARGQGNPHKHQGQQQMDQDDQGEDEDRDDQGHGRPIFRKRDREIIIEFYRSHPSNLPPGLAKRNGNLPPGLEKHLERNGTLPPGLQKRVEPFPRELEIRLPRLPVIYRRGRIGSDVIIFNSRTGAVLNVIRDVARVAGR